MIIRRILFVILGLFAATVAVRAQEGVSKHSISLHWGVQNPLGEGNFMESPLWAAPKVGYDLRILPTLSAGVSLGYVYGAHSGDTSEVFEDAMLQGYTSRKLTIIPAQLSLRWFILGNKPCVAQPYLALSAGGSYTKFDITGDLIVTTLKSDFGFAMGAHAGVRYSPVGWDKISLDTRVLWQRTAANFAPMQITSQQNLGFELGVSIRL